MPDPTRRDFVKTSTAATAAFLAPTGLAAFAGPGRDERPINVGVIGTGGRGTGACNDTLSANPNVRIVAMADIFEHKVHNARKNLANTHGERIDVPDERIFTGLDAYRRVIEHPEVDLVIFTTPPGFRPMHLAACVDAGKHAFVEKPVCVDAAGYRSCIESGRKAREQGTAIVTGTQYRRQPSYMTAMERIHDGMIGRITSGVSYYCSSGIWYRDRQPGMSDVEYQLNNWYHFVWLCGDQIVEQAVHNLDAMNWAMAGRPLSAYGSGGQMTRPTDSEIYDNMSIDFEYEGGANISFKCRQIPNSTTSVINTFVGTKGIAYVNPEGSRIVSHDGAELFRHDGRGNNPYQREHKDMVASILAGEPIVEIDETARSSLTAVLGRMAAYSGKRVSWQQAAGSALDLLPTDLTLSGPAPAHGVAVPGQWQLV